MICCCPERYANEEVSSFGVYSFDSVTQRSQTGNLTGKDARRWTVNIITLIHAVWTFVVAMIFFSMAGTAGSGTSDKDKGAVIAYCLIMGAAMIVGFLANAARYLLCASQIRESSYSEGTSTFTTW